MADQEIGGLIVRMKADLTDYQQKLDKMDKETVKTSSKVSNAFKGMSNIIAGAGIAVSGFAATAIKSAMDWGNAVDDLADKTGMAGEEASKLLYIAKSVGVGTEEANMMFARFSRTIYNSADAMAKASAAGQASDDILSKLGVSAVDLSTGAMRDTVDIFQDVKDKLNDMSDGWQKTAYEMELFGRSGTDMHDMLSMSREDMEKVVTKAKAMGLIISSETAAAWEKFERQLNATKGTMTGIGITIGNEMLPKLQEMLNDVQGVSKAYVNMDSKQKETVNSLVELVAKIGVATAAVKGVEWVIGRSLGPWGLLAAAIWQTVDALKAWKTEKGTVKEVFVFDGPNHGHTVKIRDMPTEHGGASRWEDYNKANPPETKTPDVFTGGGGVGAEAKTALQEYQEETRKLISLWEAQVKLEEISKEQYKGLLAERLAGTAAVAANDDEASEKKQAQYDLLIKIFDASEQVRQSVIEQAQQQRQLGNITNEQLAETLTKQYELADSERERIAILLQLKGVYDQLKTAANEYYEAAYRQLEDEAEQGNKELAEAKKRGEDSARKDLKMTSARYGSSDINGQIKEINQMIAEAKEKLAKKYWGNSTLTADQTSELDARLKALFDARESLINDQVANEIDAARRSKEAWADNLADIISGTRSAHDILKQQWKEFVAEVLKQQLKISASSNVFDSLLGGVFGLKKTKVDGARASGGPVNMGKTYLVGERGPELFVPSQEGSIIPNADIVSGRAAQQQNQMATSSLPEIEVKVINNTGTEAKPTVTTKMDSNQMIINVVLDGVTRNVNGLQDAVAAAARRGR